jgi:hypothetical protein
LYDAALRAAPAEVEVTTTEAWTGYTGRHAFAVALAATLVTVLASLLVLLWGLGRAVSHPESTGLVSRWFLALWDGLVVDRTRFALAWSYLLFLASGVGYGVVYGRAVAPVLYRVPSLRDRPWLCGLLYAPLPWCLTVFVGLPVVGAGMLGSHLASGGMPWLALAAHGLHSVLVASWLRLTE